MNLYSEGKEFLSEAERFLDQIDKKSFDSYGIRSLRFYTKKFTYKFEIIEGIFVTPFLMLSVYDKNKTVKDMITQDQINVKNIIKLFKDLKNEI